MKKVVIATSLFFAVLVAALWRRSFVESGAKEGVRRRIAVIPDKNPPPPPHCFYNTSERKLEIYRGAVSRHNDKNAGKYYSSIFILFALDLFNMFRSKKTTLLTVRMLITRFLKTGVLTVPKKAVFVDCRNGDGWYGFERVSHMIKRAAASRHGVFPPHIHGVILPSQAGYADIFGFTHASHGKNIFCFGG